MKKMLALLLSCTTLAGTLAGCNNGGSSSSTAQGSSEPAAASSNTQSSEAPKDLPKITFYHSFYQDDWQPAVEMRKIYDEFAQKHKDEFTFEAIPLEGGPDAVYNKCVQEVAAGSFPDMVDTAGWDIVPAASSAGLILDLKPYLDKDADFKSGVGVNYEQNLVDGKIYTAREQIETMGFWYNEDLFQKAGAATPDKWSTWDDFNTAVDKLKASPDVKTPFSMIQGWSTDIVLNAYLLGSQEGRDFLSKPPESFDSPAFKDALNFISKDVLGKIDSKYLAAADSDNYRDDFFKGDAAMLFNGVWDAGSFSGDNIKVDPKYFKPAVFPTSEAGKKAAIMSASCGYVISNKLDEAKTNACVEFVKYMCSADIAEKIFTNVLAMPAYLSVDYDKYSSDADVTVASLALACKLCANADYKTRSMNTNWSEDTAAAIGSKYAALQDGSKTPDQVVAELNQTLQ